jgi:hypothetical protein
MNIEEALESLRAITNDPLMQDTQLGLLAQEYLRLYDEKKQLEEVISLHDAFDEIGRLVSDLPIEYCLMHTPTEWLVREMTSLHSTSYRGANILLAIEKYLSATNLKSTRKPKGNSNEKADELGFEDD